MRGTSDRVGPERDVNSGIWWAEWRKPIPYGVRLQGELLKLGIEISERTVSRLRPQHRKPPSQTWRAFSNNHVQDWVSVDFCSVPTVSLRGWFVLVVLAHRRRRVAHFHVTEYPTAAWTPLQILKAFPDDTAPRYWLRDRDQIYGEGFRPRLRDRGTTEVLPAPQSPWQNPFVERRVGSLRREGWDHAIIRGEKHWRRILKEYFDYCLGSRTHLAFAKDAPTPRVVQGPEAGQIEEIPQVGGLHPRDERRAA